MTWNIRYNNPGDSINAWPNRKESVFTLIREVHPALIGMQEVLAGQLEDLNKALPQYASFGVGRDDGKNQGEFGPILYDQSRFRFLNGDFFWLSESPDKPGKLGWDAVCARMVTWVRLIDQTTGDTLCFFNTHFDHIGVKARLMSSKLLVRSADSLAGKHPAIITGDFNSTLKDSPYQVITGAGFQDSKLVSETEPKGPEYTFTGFRVYGKPGDRIDYIYLKNTKPVKSYIVRDESLNGFYPSDHLPVIIHL